MPTNPTPDIALDRADWLITKATGLMSNPNEFDAHLGLLLSEFRDGLHHDRSPVGKWWVIQHRGALAFVTPQTPDVRPLGTITVEQKTETYRGFIIAPKKDFGSTPYFIHGRNVWHGWNVLDATGNVNVLPGATWGRTIAEARLLADALLAAGGDPEREGARASAKVDADKFWRLVDSKLKKTASKVVEEDPLVAIHKMEKAAYERNYPGRSLEADRQTALLEAAKPTLDPEDTRSHEHPEREPVASDPSLRDPGPLMLGQVATLRARAVGALYDYRRALLDIRAAGPAVQRVDDALKNLGAA